MLGKVCFYWHNLLMIDIQHYYGKLARREAILEEETVALLKELAAFRAGAAYLASCQGATLEGLPKSASKAQRYRHASICTTAAKIMRGDLSNIQHPTQLEAAAERCIRAAQDVQ